MDISDYSPAPDGAPLRRGHAARADIYAGIAGMGMIEEAGVPAIQAHVRGLVDRLLDGLDELGATVVTPREPAARPARLRPLDRRARARGRARRGRGSSPRRATTTSASRSTSTTRRRTSTPSSPRWRVTVSSSPEPASIVAAAIGDSITAGSPWDDDPAIGWPAAAASADPRLRFTVRAVYGKRTDEIATWLDEAVAGADVLVVQGGINDIAQGRPVADAAANLGSMVSAARSAACASSSRTSFPGTTAGRGAEAPIRELNALIAGLGVPVLAFHETLEDPDRPGRMREDWTLRRRSSVCRGLPAPRRASVPAPMSSYGARSMTAPLRRVLVRPPQPADAARWREYGWRAEPDPAAAVGRARGAARHPRECRAPR